MDKKGQTTVVTAELARPGRRAAGQDPAKREQILDGAKRIFTAMGFDAASMNDITREANVSKGTIYVYFNNKEELFEALIERERKAIFSDARLALTGDGTPADKLNRFGRLIVRLVCSESVIRAQRIVIGVGDRMPAMARGFFERGPQKGLANMVAFLESEVEKGTLRIDDLPLAANQFSELCMAGIFRRRLFGHMDRPPSDAEIARTVDGAVAMFLNYYGTGKAG